MRHRCRGVKHLDPGDGHPRGHARDLLVGRRPDWRSPRRPTPRRFAHDPDKHPGRLAAVDPLGAHRQREDRNPRRTPARFRAGPGSQFRVPVAVRAGERVIVAIRLTGRWPIRSSFTVAHLGPIGPPLNIPIIQPATLDRFVSAPGLLPPRITVNRRAPGLAGDVFLTPLPAPASAGRPIMPRQSSSFTPRSGFWWCWRRSVSSSRPISSNAAGWSQPPPWAPCS